MKPSGGMTMSLTNEFTMVVNAAPMTMPTAISMTLPRIANSLNSLMKPMALLLKIKLQAGEDAHIAVLAAGIDLGLILVLKTCGEAELVGLVDQYLPADFVAPAILAKVAKIGKHS